MKKILSALMALIMLFSMSVVAQARLVGDVNNDNAVTSLDALDVLMFSVGKLLTIDKNRADVNADSTINSQDALIILNIIVGSYTGELEINDELITTYKKDVIDPISQSGEFTIKAVVVSKDKNVPSTIMVRGNDMATDITYSGIDCRLLILDGHAYMIFPKFRVYSEINGITLSSTIAGSETDSYSKSEYIVISGKTYVCETYTCTDGSVRKYYFLNGVWKASQTTIDNETTTQRIEDFKKGVDSSHFSLNGYYKVSDLEGYV